MRLVAAVVMFVHGVAHLPGFLVSWRLASFDELPYRTTILAGRLDLGDHGIQIVGILWAALAFTFLAAGAAAFLRLPWWGPVAQAAVALSLVLCAIGWPETRIGVLVNIALGIWLLSGAAR